MGVYDRFTGFDNIDTSAADRALAEAQAAPEYAALMARPGDSNKIFTTPVEPYRSPQPPPEKRSTLGEIWSQLKAGAFVDIPRMTGKAMQYFSDPGHPVYETGKGLVEDAQATGELPEMRPSAASDGVIVGSLAKGARMIPAAAGAVAAGLLAAEAGLPAAAAGVVGAALPAIPFSLSKAQETYEAGLHKHGITPEQAAQMPSDPRVQEALNASRLTGGIEFAANTAGGALANRLVGVGGKFVAPLFGKLLEGGERTAAQTALRQFTNPQALARFGLDTLETGAEQTAVQAARAGSETAVEKAYGYSDQSPWDAAKETVPATLGMTTLMAPLGIPGRFGRAGEVAHVVDVLRNPEYSPELRTQAAEAVYNHLNDVAPDAANNFAARAFDAIHGHEETGSAPYGFHLDDSAIEPFTPQAFHSDETAGLEHAAAVEMPLSDGPLGRAVSKGMTQTATVGTDGAFSRTTNKAMPEQGNQTEQPATMAFTAPDINEASSVNPEQSGRSGHSTEEAPEIPNVVLRHFLESGREKTQQSGQGVHVWDKPHKPILDNVMRDYVVPAEERGDVTRDGEGGYIVQGDNGALRIVTPVTPEGNYRVEYHAPAAQSGTATEAPPLNWVQQRMYENLSRKQQAGERLDSRQQEIFNKLTARVESGSRSGIPSRVVNTMDTVGHEAADSLHASEAPPLVAGQPETMEQPAVSISREAVEKAFPGQTITEHPDGFTVNVKYGNRIRITGTGEIALDADAARAAHGREIKPDEKPVASFQRLGPDAVITMTERGAGEIDHETFHAAMNLALNSKQRDVIIKQFGTEEAAAKEYQRLKDSGAFAERKGPLFFQMMNRFYGKVRDLINLAMEVMGDVASGKVWEGSLALARAEAGRYSFGDVAEKMSSVKGHLDRFTDKSTFIKADVKPAMKAAGEGAAVAWDGIKVAVNPMARSAAAEEAGRILIEGMGKMEHGREKLVTELNKAALQSTQQVTRTAKLLDLMQSSTTLADKVFNTMPEAQRLDFMQRMDTGQKQATPELQRIADVIRTMFEEKVQAVQNLGTGALDSARENYFPHMWKRGEDVGREINSALSRRPLEGSKAFTKARVFDDIMTGINAGHELVSTNPVDLVFLKMSEMDKYINAHTGLQAMDESGLVRLIPAGDAPPEGYGDISGRYGIVTKRGFVDPVTGMEGERKSYRYVAREDVAQIFNNYLSQNLYNNKYIGKPFTGYMRAANTLNQFQLGVFSAFHAGFTSLEAVISHAALGIKAFSRGDFGEAANYLKQAPAAWYTNPRLGDRVLKAWMGDPAAAKEMPQMVEWLQMAGARRMLDARFRTNATDSMLRAWADGNKAGAVLRTIPALVESSARPIMEWLVPRQKLGVFAEMANDWYSRNPEASHEQTRAAMQKIWNRVDSRLGQVVYDRLFVHNVAKNMAQAVIRAPGWTGGTILEVGGGLKDLAGFAKDMAKGKKPELSDRAAYTLSLLVTTAVTNATLTALFTGEPPKEWKDLVAFRTGGRDERGNPERFMLPSYMKDVYAYMQQPGATLMHKTHPLLSLAGDLVSNKDYYGTEIRHPGDNPVMQLAQMAGFTAKAFVPFWMKGLSKEHDRGGSLLSMAAPLVGVMPAPAEMNKTAAEKLAGEMVRARMPSAAKTQEQFERSQLVAHLTNQVRQDHNEGLQGVNQALNGREINRLQALHVMQNARLTPLQVAFRRLSYDEALKVFELADSAEKRQLRRMLQVKRENVGRG